MTTPSYWKRAVRELTARDPVLAALMEQYRGLALGSRGDAFQTLARAIVGQQISVKAAQSVWDRLAALSEGVTPTAIRALQPEVLRRAGLSMRKAEYVQDLALRFLDGRLNPSEWAPMDDEALIECLTQVRGIGRWTAEMFLIFNLGRPDVLPVADLGLQRAMSLHYNRGRALSARRIQQLAQPWSPWRSVATWYLWRSLDPIPVEY